MKKWFALFLLFTACKSNTPETFNTRVPDSLFNFYEQHDLYFVSAEISKGAQRIFKRSVGYEKVEENKLLDSNSIFLIGSITKTYTAAMILQLVEEGALSLTDKLSRFYPEIPNSNLIDIDTYENQLQTRILNKLGLRNTYYGRPDDLSNFAYSYVYLDDQWVKAEPA